MTPPFRLALAQLAPAYLDREAGIAQIVDAVRCAARERADLVVFPEALLPGYPFWLSEGHGARFDDPRGKRVFAHYSDQAVSVEDGHLDPVRDALRDAAMCAWVGIVERPRDRSGHSLYCAYVFIDASGKVRSVHRKLAPTFEERLVWSPGDGAGLVTHRVGPFTTGGLNCWENWMPLSRAALYAQGEDLHVACWPGNARNTRALTPVLAMEGRSYAVSVCGVMRASDIPDDAVEADYLRAAVGELAADGGSCVCAPDGSFLMEPWVAQKGAVQKGAVQKGAVQKGTANDTADDTGVRVVELDPARVRAERQNFDPAGHYSRPDVTRLVVDRTRQGLAQFRNGPEP